MNKHLKISVLLLLFFTFFLGNGINAQIHDIKKNSNTNKNNKSSSSSDSNYSNSNDNSDCVSGCIGSIIGELFSGCLTSIFDNSGKNKNNDDFVDNYSNNDDLFPMVENSKPTNVTENENPNLPTDSLTSNNDIPSKIDENEINTDIVDNQVTNNQSMNEFSNEREKDFSLDINGNFALALHKGVDKMYTYVDYLPGLRANLDIFMIDFRFNILTEYTNGFPDSFTTWELLFMANLTANQNFKLIIGTGLQREDLSKTNFNEFYLGTKIPSKNGRNYLDADMRVSVDFKTDAVPFFEIGGRYNTRVMDFGHLSGYISLGAAYQNYYQSHDIWALTGGVIMKIH